MGVENNIAEGWGKYSIGDFGKIITGKTPSKNNPEDWGDKIDFITPSDIPNNLKVISNCARKLSEQGENRFNRMILPSGSVIVTCIGSDMGKVVMNKNKSLTNQQINSIIINDTYSNEFIYYLLKRSHKVLRRAGEGSGSTMPLLNKSHFESLSFEIPPLPEQKAIAKVLTAFDDKIELLQEQNKTLETMAQAIFKEWFGKYQIGDELPEGWRLDSLGKAVKIKQGKYVKSEKISETQNHEFKYPVYGGGGVRGYLQSYVYDTPQVILTCRGNGCGLIQLSKNYSTITNSCMTLEYDNSKLDFTFLYLFSKNINFEIYTSGSAQPQITVTNLEGLEIIIPNEIILKKFIGLVEPLFEKINNNYYQIKSLSKTRDTLLPKLMSGQVRVNNTKQTVDA